MNYKTKQTGNNNQTARIPGDVFLSQPDFYAKITLGILIIVVFSLVFLFYGTYSKRVSVRGVITTNKGLSKIVVNEKGSVEKVNYSSGDFVQKGKLLYTISTTRNSLRDDDLDADILVQLSNSKKIIQEGIANEEKLQALNFQSLSNEKVRQEKELSLLINQKAVLKKRALIAKENLAQQKELLRNKHLTKQEYNKFNDLVLDIQYRSEEINLRISNAQYTLESLNNRMLEHPIVAKKQNNKLKHSLNQLNQQIIEISARRNYNINSPISGVIATSLVKSGETVRSGQNIMTILPEDTEFQAELYIPSDAIGFVKIDQKVAMRYSAFPYQHFGLYYGKIVEISKVISQPTELKDKVNLDQAVFKVTVNLNSQSVELDGVNFPLQVGMHLDANIILGSRSLIQWILQPLLAIGKS